MTNELYHHGVKGQSWGKRNGPPYPLYRKSAYYKKTGKRPPGYTGDKKGKSDSGGPNKSGKIGGLSDLKRAGGVRGAINTTKNAGKKGRIGGLPNENAKGNTDTQSEAERKAKLKKRILIGAGIAAGVAGGALIGRKLYQAKAAQGAAGVESAASKLRTAFKRNKAAQSEAKKIAADLTNQRNKLTIDRFNAQTARNEAVTKKGLSGFLKRRKIKKNIANLDSKLAENAAAKSRNAFTAGETEMKYKYAQRALKDSLATNEGLKKLGRRQAIASTLGLGLAGGATGYGISKIANRRKQKARIQNRRTAKGRIGSINGLFDSPEVRQKKKAEKAYNKAYRKNYIDAYNEAADAMNSGGIAKFNSSWEKKHGEINLDNPNFNSQAYEDAYMKQFYALVEKNIEKRIGKRPR